MHVVVQWLVSYVLASYMKAIVIVHVNFCNVASYIAILVTRVTELITSINKFKSDPTYVDAKLFIKRTPHGLGRPYKFI